MRLRILITAGGSNPKQVHNSHQRGPAPALALISCNVISCSSSSSSLCSWHPRKKPCKTEPLRARRPRISTRNPYHLRKPDPHPNSLNISQPPNQPKLRKTIPNSPVPSFSHPHPKRQSNQPHRDPPNPNFRGAGPLPPGIPAPGSAPPPAAAPPHEGRKARQGEGGAVACSKWKMNHG